MPRNNKLDTDPDYIESAKYNNSLRKLLDDNPDGVSDALICRALDLSQKELKSIYECAIKKLRQALSRSAESDDEE